MLLVFDSAYTYLLVIIINHSENLKLNQNSSFLLKKILDTSLNLQKQKIVTLSRVNDGANSITVSTSSLKRQLQPLTV